MTLFLHGDLELPPQHRPNDPLLSPPQLLSLNTAASHDPLSPWRSRPPHARASPPIVSIPSPCPHIALPPQPGAAALCPHPSAVGCGISSGNLFEHIPFFGKAARAGDQRAACSISTRGRDDAGVGGTPEDREMLGRVGGDISAVPSQRGGEWPWYLRRRAAG
jgi:hypothetical protein